MVARPGTLQCSFGSGEVAPELWSRSDVKQFFASAALMSNVEPVPQGGFRLSARSRDLGPQRTRVVQHEATLQVVADPVGPGQAVAVLSFGGPRLVAMVRFVCSASVVADAGLAVEYRLAATGNWYVFVPGRFGLSPDARGLMAALPPGQSRLCDAVRLVYAGAGPNTVSVPTFAAYQETGEALDAQLAAFTVSIDQAYMVCLTSSAVADIYRDGAFVGSAWHDLVDQQAVTATSLQRLNTLLLFHPDKPTRRLRRGAADHEWLDDLAPFEAVPPVDLGGSYPKTDEVWQLALRWPNDVSPVGYALVVSIDGQDTPVVTITSDWSAVVTDIKARVEALSTVDDGVVVTDEAGGAGLRLINMRFAGRNAGSRFVVSAKFVNTAEGGASALRFVRGAPGGEPLFSEARGYAACGTFYQDRLVQGGFRSKPGAILASPTADYFSGNIDVETATGGLLIDMDTDGAERVQRIARSKHLVIFTSDGEYYVSDRVLRRDQPMNIVESSRNGSCPTVPICTTETALLYVSRSRSLVYSAAYDDVQQAYVSEPLSLLAKHLIKGIKDAALQRADDDTDAARYYLVRDDGTMVVGHIIRSQEVTAFVRWRTDGYIRSVAVDGANRVHIAIDRVIGGAIVRRVERLEPGLLLDAAVSRSFDAPRSVVDGLAALEGATVWAIADGWTQGPFTVAGGAITLAEPAAAVTVGRWTPPVVTTLPLARDVGPRIVLERPSRVHTVMLKVLETTSVAIGANGEPPEAIPLYRAGMPTDVPQPPVTEWLTCSGLEGWSIEGQVTVTQLRPGALRVAAVNIQART